jgi:phthiodiolone/phenolphthiodiolone dimycocerosates ketoreductase
MGRFHVGLGAVIVNARVSATAGARVNYLTAAASGADSFWVGDHLNALFPRSIATPRYSGAAKYVPKIDAQLEPWTILGHIAARHRFTRVRLGIGVTDVSRRHPAVTAQAAATLNLTSRGRAVLGLGVGERECNEPYGVDWTRPVARFEEAVATIRALWDSQGRLVTRNSRFFPLRDAVFDLPAYRGRWPQIWIAAHRPRMLGIAGRYADAWFPASLLRPTDYGHALESVRSSASDAGRDPASIIPAAWLSVFTGRSRSEVDEALDTPAVKALALTFPGSLWSRHNVIHPLGENFSGGQDLVPQVLDEKTVLSYVRNVPRSLLTEGILCGTPAEVIDQLATWRDHGLRYPVLCNVSMLQPDARQGMAATVPFFRALRGLRKFHTGQ